MYGIGSGYRGAPQPGVRMNFLLVGLGGSVGAVLRYIVGRQTPQASDGFPLGTFIVNTTGAFILGWLSNRAGQIFPSHMNFWTLFLGVGMCGAYTTFSTFSYESWRLLRAGRNSLAVWYMLTTTVVGLGASALGLIGLP